MKNIHILPTDKPSRLFIDIDNDKLTITNNPIGGEHMMNQNIYITNSEEIKEGDWCIVTPFGIDKFAKVIRFKKENGILYNLECKKIILTTDQELINDDVQEIPDEFLKWFVKNPSCEEVEVKPLMAGFVDDEPSYYENMYEIIIPKEETLEEALTAEEFFRNKIKENIEWEGEITLWKVPLNAELSMRWAKEYSDYVIKWQQERSYSEEEIQFNVNNLLNTLFKGKMDSNAIATIVNEWFEQFKNK